MGDMVDALRFGTGVMVLSTIPLVLVFDSTKPGCAFLIPMAAFMGGIIIRLSFAKNQGDR